MFNVTDATVEHTSYLKLTKFRGRVHLFHTASIALPQKRHIARCCMHWPYKRAVDPQGDVASDYGMLKIFNGAFGKVAGSQKHGGISFFGELW